MMRPDVSLVIASYNNAGEIEGTLEKALAYFEKQPYSHELIVVNDGSTDLTRVALERFSLRCPELRILVNATNMGKGHSIRRGILDAGGRYVFYTDADLAYPIEGIESFLAPLREGAYDVAVGSRVHASSLFHLHPRYFRYVYRRHLMSRLFNWTVRASLGIRVMDTQCGFKGFTGEAARAIFSRVGIRGFAFDVEVLLLAQRLGFRLVEIPVTFAYAGEVSSVRIMKTAFQALTDLTRIYLHDRRGQYRGDGQGRSHSA
jgi:glycosyltransferase involved in cell wall biosynthesis